jgi:hypothetical protein
MASESHSAQELNAFKVESIRANLETAVAFAKMARQSDDNKEITRYRQNACDACEEALHSLRTATLTHIEWESFRTKLALLEAILMELGEIF